MHKDINLDQETLTQTLNNNFSMLNAASTSKWKISRWVCCLVSWHHGNISWENHQDVVHHWSLVTESVLDSESRPAIKSNTISSKGDDFLQQEKLMFYPPTFYAPQTKLRKGRGCKLAGSKPEVGFRSNFSSWNLWMAITTWVMDSGYSGTSCFNGADGGGPAAANLYMQLDVRCWENFDLENGFLSMLFKLPSWCHLIRPVGRWTILFLVRI